MHTESIPLNKVEYLQKNAKIIVDLSHENRQGLTINAITALAKGKKLITTNRRISQESFYHPENVYILDVEKPYIDMSFFSSKPVPVDMRHLRIDNWLRTILNN